MPGEIRAAVREEMAARDSAVGSATVPGPRVTPRDGPRLTFDPAPSAVERAAPTVPRRVVATDTSTVPAPAARAALPTTDSTRRVTEPLAEPLAERLDARTDERAMRERRVLDSVEARMAERRAAYGVADADARELPAAAPREVNEEFVRPVLRTLTFGGVTPRGLVEHQGVDLFDVNRLVLGLAWR